MRVSTWIGLGLGLFYLVAGFGYALTAEFVDGFPLLMTAAVGVALLGGYAYLAVRRAEQAVAAGSLATDPVEPHVGSTIWPFGYALSAVGLVLGFMTYKPLYAVGGVLFLAATSGWFADVRQQWQHSHEQPPEPGPPRGPDTTPLPDEGIL
jgi:hypothetical protein